MAATSTPLPQSSSKSKKRKSLFGFNDANESPLKRVSATDTPDANEEEERSLRRDRCAPDVYSKEEMKLHVDTCMQLYNDNKINAKNVWACHIIDHMNVMVRDNLFEKDTLKYATATLEVGAKVYGLRVDSVYDQTLQLASNLQRNFNEDDDGGGAENCNGDIEGKGVKKKRTKRVKLLKGTATSIIKDYTSTFKPVKQMISADFNMGQSTSKTEAGSSFLSYCVPVNNQGYFMGLSKANYFDQNSLPTEDNSLNATFDFVDISAHSLNLCPPFADFAVDILDEDNDFHVTRSETVLDADGNPVPELDGSIYDPFQGDLENNSPDEDENVIVNEMQMGQPNIQFISDVITPDIHSSNQYSYLATNGNQMLVNLWAGPHHWKLKTVQQRSHTFTGIRGQSNQKRQRRQKRAEATEADFDENEGFSTKSLKKMRKLLKLRFTEKFRLQMKFVLETSHPRFALKNKEILITTENNAAVDNNDDDDEGLDADEFNYNNPNDSQLCIDAGEGNNYDNHHQELGIVDQRQMDEHSFEAPEIVPKSTIAYAKTAKRMDMKRLKNATWDVLANCDTYSTGSSTQDSTARVESTQDLREVYKKLPNIISQAMREALSLPLAFSALLHLCNEKNLRLERTADLKSVKITQDA